MPVADTQNQPLLERIRGEVRGRVIGPDDPEYDAARSVVNGAIDRRPSAIVRVADAADVTALVRLARDLDLRLAIRGGGHSGAGHGTVDDGVVLDLRELRGLSVDPGQRVATAGTGLTAAAYMQATAAHGLSTGFGDTGSVGIGGITLGGGVGFLVRKHGLTIDSLLGADVVTADGEHLRVDDRSHPDLFWAIRGGGGNFGVATSLTFRLHAVDRVLGGMLILPATPEVVCGFMAAADAAPDELSTIANVMNCPPMPFVPEEHHGSLVVFALLCHAGEVAAGEAAIAPFRALAEPLADLVRPITYPEMYLPDDPSYRPIAVSRTMFMRRVGTSEAETIVGQLAASDASVRVVQLRALGGSMARVPADATAFAHRSSPIMVNVAAFIDAPDQRPERSEWVTRLAAALHQGDDGAYVNFLEDEGEARVRAAYPGPTWERLTRVKARYDPTNLFRLNQNIPPAA